MPKLWFFDGAKGTPDSAVCFEDADHEWHEALSKVEVTDRKEKTNSPAICGAEFAPGATSKEQTEDNLLWSHAVILDVDVWEDRKPFTLEELKEQFEGLRAIFWKTFSSSPAEQRWRVVVPLKTPMPPTKHASLCKYLNDCLENTVAESTFDPGRLGFFGTVGSETGKDDYEYYISQGEYLDWTVLDLEEEDLTGHKKALTPANLTRSPDWISEEQALQSAKRYFKRSGEEVEVGNRHAHLLKVACRLWWEWAIESRENVAKVLHEVNESFSEPKSFEDVEAEIEAGYERVFGENRVEQPTLYGAQRDPIERSSVAAITERGKRLKRSKEDAQRLVGRALLHLAKGEPVGDATEARTLISKAAEELARSYPRDTPERLLDLMRPSLRAQRAAGTTSNIPTDVEVINVIKHVQGIQRRRQEAKEQEKLDQLTERIQKATKYRRSTPYSAQEYRRFERNGLTDRSWILWHGRSFYFFCDGEYVGPFSDREAQLEAYIYFSPAEDRVQLSTMTNEGKLRRYTIDELASMYGSPIENVFSCLDRDTSCYKPREAVLEVARAPLRELDPQFCPEIDIWLQKLAQDKYDVLCDWLAALPYVDKPLAALYLCTKKGQGKNLLIEGLARLWSTGGYPLLSKFKPEHLEMCPMVFCDERLPYDWKQDVAGRLRSFISQSVRPVSLKYKNDYFLRGYARLVFASNTSNLLGSLYTLQQAEQDAYSDRVLLINTLKNSNVADEAGDYLASLSQSGFVLDDFIHKDLLAKHVLWLRDNRKIDFRKRFFVDDPQKEFAKATTVGDVFTNRLMEWVFSFVESGVYRNDAVLSRDQKIYVNATYAMDVWDAYDADKKEINVNRIGRALNKVGKKVKVERDGAKKIVKRYYILNEEIVDYWTNCREIEKSHLTEICKKLEDAKGFKIV